MDNYIIKSRIGKTPLIRAINLEKELGLSKIFLKLEGNNPSGYKEDRLANIMIKEAISLGKTTICLGIYSSISESILYLTSYFNIKCVLVLPTYSKENIPSSRLKSFSNNDSLEIIYQGNTKEEALEYSNKLSTENNWYNANPSLENKILNMTASSYICEEISSQLKENIDRVFCQADYYSSISGFNLGFRKLWTDEKINKNPLLYHCKAEDKSSGEVILEEISPLNNRMIKLTSKEVAQNINTFKRLENIHLNTSKGYAIAGFIKEASQGNLKDGNHVIILDNGKIDLDIREISLENCELSKEEIVNITDTWLMEYTDPKLEIVEAVDNAFERGFVIFAYHNNILSGICIIIDFGFEHFATKYHLAYIATNKNVKGRGIATQLLNKAIEVSHGNLSLHVELSNKGAIKLYEKMGFNSSYIRMIHKSKY